MANRQMDVRLILRNGPAAQWSETNPILLKGEIGLEIDTGKMKIGDGVTIWSGLAYFASFEVHKAAYPPTASDSAYDLGMEWLNTATGDIYFLVDNTSGSAVWQRVVTDADLDELGSGDMLKSIFADNAKVAQGYVSRAIASDSLMTARTISGSGVDIEATATPFNGSANITIPMILKDTGVSAGTYTKLTIDVKGRVVSASMLSETDIPNLTLSKITDAGTAAAVNVGTSSGNVPVLNAAGKLDNNVLPALSIMDIFPDINGDSAMTALNAQKGDIALRVDTHTTWILVEEPASVLSNWSQLETPTSPITSVNGKIGTVVLSTTDITEGTNKYWTDARFDDSFGSKIATTAVGDLSNGAEVLMLTDTYVFNGGTATT